MSHLAHKGILTFFKSKPYCLFLCSHSADINKSIEGKSMGISVKVGMENSDFEKICLMNDKA